MSSIPKTIDSRSDSLGKLYLTNIKKIVKFVK